MLSRVNRNAFYSLFSAVFRLAGNGLIFILIAKFYGPGGLGQFAIAHTLASVFILFADFGIDLLLTTEVSRRPSQAIEIGSRMAGLKLVSSSLACVGMSVFAHLQGFPTATIQLVDVFCVYLFFSSMLSFVFALFRAHEEMESETFIMFAMNLFLILATILLGVLGTNLLLIGIAFAFSRIFGLLIGIRKYMKSHHVFYPAFDLKWSARAWEKMWVFGIFVLFGNLFFSIDTILLSVMKSEDQVGIYQSAFRLVGFTLIVPEVAVTSVLPSLTRLHGNGSSEWSELGSWTNEVLYFLSLPIGFIFFLLPNAIVNLIYGSEGFQEATSILQIFGFLIIVRYSFETSALMLTTSKRQKDRMKLVVLATFFSLILNLLLIPTYGIVGAAFVSLLTNMLVGIGYAYSTRQEFPQSWLSRRRVVPLLALVSFGLIIESFQVVHRWIWVIGACVLYSISVFRYGFTDDQRMGIARYLRKYEIGRA